MSIIGHVLYSRHLVALNRNLLPAAACRLANVVCLLLVAASYQRWSSSCVIADEEPLVDVTNFKPPGPPRASPPGGCHQQPARACFLLVLRATRTGSSGYLVLHQAPPPWLTRSLPRVVVTRSPTNFCSTAVADYAPTDNAASRRFCRSSPRLRRQGRRRRRRIQKKWGTAQQTKQRLVLV